jgi:hypothetical protein
LGAASEEQKELAQLRQSGMVDIFFHGLLGKAQMAASMKPGNSIDVWCGMYLSAARLQGCGWQELIAGHALNSHRNGALGIRLDAGSVRGVVKFGLFCRYGL